MVSSVAAENEDKRESDWDREETRAGEALDTGVFSRWLLPDHIV